jgi:hypothetical protein
VFPFSTGKYLPNRMGFLLLQGLEEAIGRDGQRTLLRTADPDGQWKDLPSDNLEKTFDFVFYAAICGTLETVYGQRTARRILYQASRSSFRRAIRGFSGLGGMDNPDFYAQSVPSRVENGLVSVARLLRLLTDIDLHLIPIPHGYALSMASCPECSGRTGLERLCFSMAGMIRGTLDWLGLDPQIDVAETQCIANGAGQCEFRIAA